VTGRHLVLLGGGPGAGKTTLAEALVRRVPEAVLLDKDEIAGPWVDRMLSLAAGRCDERDSAYYWSEVRPLEYAALEALVWRHLGLGKSVVAVAPFGRELADATWRDRVRDRAGGFGARVVELWMSVEPDLARSRLARRGQARDARKLAGWEAFLAGDPYACPVAGLVQLDSAQGVEACAAKVFALLGGGHGS
jgi:predicted kinase